MLEVALFVAKNLKLFMDADCSISKINKQTNKQKKNLIAQNSHSILFSCFGVLVFLLKVYVVYYYIILSFTLTDNSSNYKKERNDVILNGMSCDFWEA